MAINEAITVLGMVLAVLTQNKDNIMPFAVVSLLLCLVNFFDLKIIMDRAKHLLEDQSFYQYY
jgi:hypothetical protein